MTSLITGADGFIGSWLTLELKKEGDKVVGLSRKSKQYPVDLLDSKKVTFIIEKVKPDRVFHLAAQSNIPYSFNNPQETIKINVIGTINLLEAIRNQRKKAVIISVGSSAEYGNITSGRFAENSELNPSSPYAVSKVAQMYMVKTYRNMYKLNIVHVRPFAIIGAGKTDDAVSDFARGIAAIEQGKTNQLNTGDLSRTRDFLDVRDAVAAMKLISEKASDSQIVNICSGEGTTLKHIMKLFVKNAKVKVKIKETLDKVRQSDDKSIIGDSSKLTSLGFNKRYSLERSLVDILEFWRLKS